MHNSSETRAQMMFLSEMPADTENILNSFPRDKQMCELPVLRQNAAVEASYRRPESQWVTCRQEDPQGIPYCIAVQSENTDSCRLTRRESITL